MSELSERLREHADIYTKLSDGWRQIIPLPSELNQAADALEAQEARIERMWTALDYVLNNAEKLRNDDVYQLDAGVIKMVEAALTLSKAPSIK